MRLTVATVQARTEVGTVAELEGSLPIMDSHHNAAICHNKSRNEICFDLVQKNALQLACVMKKSVPTE